MENFRNIVQVLLDNINNTDYNNDAGLGPCDATVKHHRAELVGEAEKYEEAKVHEFEYVRI